MTGNFATGSVGGIFGAGAGVGAVFGFTVGNVEDLTGESVSTGLAFGLFSCEVNFSEKNGDLSFQGIQIGIADSLGAGVYSVENTTWTLLGKSPDDIVQQIDNRYRK